MDQWNTHRQAEDLDGTNDKNRLGWSTYGGGIGVHSLRNWRRGTRCAMRCDARCALCPIVVLLYAAATLGYHSAMRRVREREREGEGEGIRWRHLGHLRCNASSHHNLILFLNTNIKFDTQETIIEMPSEMTSGQPYLTLRHIPHTCKYWSIWKMMMEGCRV